MAATALLPNPAAEASDRGARRAMFALLDRLDELEDEGKAGREKFRPAQTMEDCLKLFSGEQMPTNGKMPYFKADFIEAFLDRQVAELTDNRPALRVEPRKVNLAALAKILQAAIRTTWDESAVQRQVYKLGLMAGVMGSAGGYTGYDPTTGEIYIETLSLRQVGFDPAVREAALLDQHAEYFWIQRVRPIAELAMRFPVTGGTLKADVAVFEDEDTIKARTMLSPLDRLVARRFGRSGDQAAPEDVSLPRAKTWEFFLKDRNTDPTGRRLFPTYRHIVRTKDTLLSDGPLPYWDGVIPVDWFDWATHPEHPWGRSTPEQMRYMQGGYNMLLNGLVENQLITNIVQFIYDQDAIEDKTAQLIKQIPNAIVIRKKNRNAHVGFEVPQAFGADKISLAKFIFTSMQLMTGVTDVTLGENPGSLQSGAAIAGLIEGASLMNRSRQSRLEDYFTRVGQKLISRVLQFWPSDRFIALVGPTPEAMEAAKNRSEFLVNDQGEPLTVEEKQEALRYMRFSVTPGSSRPGARERRTKMMLELLKAGCVSRMDVLEAAELPNPEQMLERANEEQAKQAAAQAAAKPPPAP